MHLLYIILYNIIKLVFLVQVIDLINKYYFKYRSSILNIARSINLLSNLSFLKDLFSILKSAVINSYQRLKNTYFHLSYLILVHPFLSLLVPILLIIY